jgi:hypothetical protein
LTASAPQSTATSISAWAHGPVALRRAHAPVRPGLGDDEYPAAPPKRRRQFVDVANDGAFLAGVGDRFARVAEVRVSGGEENLVRRLVFRAHFGDDAVHSLGGQGFADGAQHRHPQAAPARLGGEIDGHIHHQSGELRRMRDAPEPHEADAPAVLEREQGSRRVAGEISVAVFGPKAVPGLGSAMKGIGERFGIVAPGHHDFPRVGLDRQSGFEGDRGGRHRCRGIKMRVAGSRFARTIITVSCPP